MIFSLNAFGQIEDENLLREIKTMTYNGFETANGTIDAKINFNNDWKFALGEYSGFEQPKFNDINWRTLAVPHDWSIEGKPEKDNPSDILGGGTKWAKAIIAKLLF